MTPTNVFPRHIEPEARLFHTQDRGLAATLLTVGFSLIGIERPSPDMCVFAFRWSENLDCAATSYWTDQFRVHPRSLIQSLHEIQRLAEAWASGEDTISTL